jgi:hypothetical protein
MELATGPTMLDMTAIAHVSVSANPTRLEADRGDQRPGSEGDPGQQLFEHAASLLASAAALEAATHVPGASVALGPTLACVEASLEALADGVDQLNEGVQHDLEASGVQTQLTATRRFGRLADAMRSCRIACADTRTSIAAAIHEPGS